jgi:hypothetical protein
MAKIKESGTSKRVDTTVSRPGIHAKTKTSKSKKSKNYKKAYRGQGR